MSYPNSTNSITALNGTMPHSSTEAARRVISAEEADNLDKTLNVLAGRAEELREDVFFPEHYRQRVVNVIQIVKDQERRTEVSSFAAADARLETNRPDGPAALCKQEVPAPPVFVAVSSDLWFTQARINIADMGFFNTISDGRYVFFGETMLASDVHDVTG